MEVEYEIHVVQKGSSAMYSGPYTSKKAGLSALAKLRKKWPINGYILVKVTYEVVK